MPAKKLNLTSPRNVSTLSDTDDGEGVNAHLPDLTHLPRKGNEHNEHSNKHKSPSNTSLLCEPSTSGNHEKKSKKTPTKKNHSTPSKLLHERVIEAELVSATDSMDSPLPPGNN